MPKTLSEVTLFGAEDPFAEPSEVSPQIVTEIEKDFEENVIDLSYFLGKIRDIPKISKMHAPTYLRDFIEGQDMAGHMLARAIEEDGRAKARLEQAEAIAYLDKASVYLKTNGIKDTAEARKQYVSIDIDVMEAIDAKSKTEAMVMLYKNKLSILRQAHDDLKKITYGDTHLTQFEGM
jgi:hypothetical protein